MYVVKFSKIYIFLALNTIVFRVFFFFRNCSVFKNLCPGDRAVGIGPSEHKECWSIPSEGYYTNVVTSNDITLSM